MLKQYLTKVIAVATIAAGSLFVIACGEKETETGPAEVPSEGEDASKGEGSPSSEGVDDTPKDGE